MKIKKINAVLALFSIFAMILHIGYNVFSYLTMYYNLSLKLLTAVPFIVITCIHAVLGMCSVFLLEDGTRIDIYSGQNKKTVVQRISAALIFPLLIIHLKTFDLLKNLAETKNQTVFVLVILIQIMFYAVVISHAAVSFSRALITLGILRSREKLKIVEKISFLAAGALFIVAVYAVIRRELFMFVF